MRAELHVLWRGVPGMGVICRMTAHTTLQCIIYSAYQRGETALVRFFNFSYSSSPSKISILS